MAKKKNTQISASQEENVQAQQLFERYQQIATTLRASENQQQVDAALAEINALPENAQMALLKDLAKEQQVDAADVLLALHEFATAKAVRKEARRALIRLEGAKIYPRWQPPAEQPLALSTTLQLSTNPPRFWKGFVTDSRELGEVQLMLAWQQGEDYKEVRVLGFLLELWHDGVKDFFTQLESKRSFENLVNHISHSMPDVKLKDCSLAEGRRLLREALAVNTSHGTKPHRDYQLHISLVNQLILEAPGLDDELITDEEEEENDEDFVDLHDLPPLEVVSSFVEYWVDGDYDLAYQLLAQESPLREGLSMDEWVERRDAWADTFDPDGLKPDLLRERAAPKSKLWLPKPFSKASEPTTKEIEAAWSIELEKTPLDEKLPELPSATTIYAESGRHWFWASYTLVQENDEWRIQSMTDEGAQARDLTVEELQKRIQELGKDAEKQAAKLTPADIKRMSETEALLYASDVLQSLLETVNYMDAHLTKLPLERELYEDMAAYAMMVGDYERRLVYVTQLIERFPEEHDKLYRIIAITQRLLSDQYFEEDEDEERSDLFAELAIKSFTASLALEESFEVRISLAEMLIDEGERLDEAKNHLLQAKNLVTDPADEAHIELHLGEIAMEQDEPQQALSHYQRMTELQPDSAEAWFAVGDVQETLEMSEEAITSYRRAIELAPDTIHYYSTLGLLYKHSDRPEQAIKVLEDGMHANPDSADLLAYRSVMYAEEGDYQQANRMLDKAEQLDPDNELVLAYRLVYKQKQPAFSQPKKLAGPKKKGHHH